MQSATQSCTKSYYDVYQPNYVINMGGSLIRAGIPSCSNYFSHNIRALDQRLDPWSINIFRQHRLGSSIHIISLGRCISQLESILLTADWVRLQQGLAHTRLQKIQIAARTQQINETAEGSVRPMISSFFIWQTPEYLSRRPVEEHHVKGVLGLVRPPRTLPNSVGKLDEQARQRESRAKEGMYCDLDDQKFECSTDYDPLVYIEGGDLILVENEYKNVFSMFSMSKIDPKHI